MSVCAECGEYPAGTRCSATTCPGRFSASIPQLADGEGHDFETRRVPQYIWELRCLIEVAGAHREGRRVSFKIPGGILHNEETSYG